MNILNSFKHKNDNFGKQSFIENVKYIYHIEQTNITYIWEVKSICRIWSK